MTDYSYQLYSSRKFGPLPETLKMLADLGYAQVEGFGGLYSDDDGLATLERGLGETGLAMPTAHMGLDMVRDTARALDIAKRLGLTTIFVPHTTDQDRDAAGWAAFGSELAEAGKPIVDAGLHYGWHNHAFEFADLLGDDTPLDLILVGGDHMMLELDLAWVHVAGADPVEWIRRHSSRLLSVHLKDVAPKGESQDEDGWRDVGHGVMAWDDIDRALAETSVKYRVVEHDNPSDDARFARRSIDFLKGR